MNILIPNDIQMESYLRSTQLINFDSTEVSGLASSLELSCCSEAEAVQKAYEYVRDRFPHTFDINETGVAVSASDVIKLGHGTCYAKVNLLAALLRSAGIPAGICYQCLCCDDPDDTSTTGTFNSRLILHAVNAIFIKSINKWVRLDARGNNCRIHAEFSLEHEKLAFTIHPDYGEKDGYVIYSDTPSCIRKVLESCSSAKELRKKLPQPYLLDKSKCNLD